MAVRFTAGTDRLDTTLALPVTGTATITCWALLATDRNATSCIWSIRETQTSGNYRLLMTAPDGTGVGIWSNGRWGGSPFAPTQVTVGEWWRFAVVIDGTAVRYLRGRPGEPLAVSSDTDSNALSATGFLRVGGTPFNEIEWWSGRVANLKVYGAALTDAEVAAELAQYRPLRTAGLLHWHPFVVAETVDYSGHGGTLTAGATSATTEAGPPIRWDGLLGALQLVAPARGAEITGSGSADLGGLTAAATGLRAISGAATADLGGIVATATGRRAISGAAAADLGGLTAAATGLRAIPGAATADLGGLTAAAAGVREAVGFGVADLGGLTAAATGLRAIPGAATADLGGLAVTAAGVREAAGFGTADLGGLVAAATGRRVISGAATADLGGLVAAARGVSKRPMPHAGAPRVRTAAQAGTPQRRTTARAGTPVSD